MKRLVQFPRLATPGRNIFTLLPLGLFLVFLPFGLTGTVDSSFAPIYHWAGLSREGLFAEHRYWQLLTHVFFHGGWLHLLGNAFAIFYFGSRIHEILGAREVLRISLWSALLGGLFHLLFQGDGLLVGASGIGLGLFVAVATISPESRMAPLPLRARNLRDGIILSSLLLLLINPSLKLPLLSSVGLTLQELQYDAVFRIGHACHLGGALAGALCVRRYLRKPITLAQLQRQRARREGHEAA